MQNSSPVAYGAHLMAKPAGPACNLRCKYCGNCAIVEHNGDVYSCDHFVYPEYKLGNVLFDDVLAMIQSDRQIEWSKLKEKTLPFQCKKCEVGPICRGGMFKTSLQ